MNNHIVLLSSLHPKKLNRKFWKVRELEYLNSFNLLKLYNCFSIIDNTINNQNEIINNELYSAINNFEFPIAFNNNIYNSQLYSNINDFGLVKMLRNFEKFIKPDVNYIFINGRVNNFDNVLKNTIKTNHGNEDFFYRSSVSNKIFSDIFLINSFNYKRFIDFFENFSEKDSFDKYLEKNIYEYKVNVFFKNLNIIKYNHLNDDYLSVTIENY